MPDRTTDPKARKELADSLREIRKYYAEQGERAYGYLFCRAVLGNFFTGLACAPKGKPQRRNLP